jgi:hypothetical protein
MVEEEGAMRELRREIKGIRRLGVHVLGAADLGVSPMQFAAELMAVEALPPGEPRWRRLGRPSKAEAPGEPSYAMSPLHAATQSECDALLLVATRQEPPDPGDSWRLAHLVEPLLHGRGVAVHIVEVHHFGLEGFKRAVKDGVDWFDRRWQPDEVVLVVGGGPKIAFLGALLGMVQAGRTPRLLEVPRKGEPPRSPSDLQLEVSLLPWLVRAHQYTFLAEQPEIHQQQRRVWSGLAAAEALDWRALAVVGVTGADLQQLRKDHPQIPIPDLSGPPTHGEPPVDEAGWRWYRRTLQASLLVRATDDPLSALFLTRPWTECRAMELAFQDPANRDHPMVAALRQGDHGALTHLLENRRELAPGPVRDLLENAEVRELCRLGSEASHGKLHRERDWRLDVRDHLETLAQDFGPECLSPMAEEHLVLLPVGETTAREERGWTADLQAEAVMTTLTDRLLLCSIPHRSVHLRLIASAQVLDHARRTRSSAEAHGLRSVEVILVEPNDIQGGTREIAGRLEQDRFLVGCAEVLLVTGPGTKSMNVAMLLAAGQWATNRAVPMQVANLKESRRSDGSGTGQRSFLEVDHERVLPRLGPDQVVAKIVTPALQWLRLSTARRVLGMASYRWRDVERSVAELERQLWGFGQRRRKTDEAQILFPARARAFASLAERDPWRAIYATCAAAEAAWPSPRRDRGFDPSPWRAKGRPWGGKLWTERNYGPFGHRIWASPPSAAQVRQLIDGVIDEVRQRPPKGPVAFRPDHAIVAALEQVKRDVERVDARIGLR